MPGLDVLVSSPFPIESLQGNSISANRIARRIADLGLRTAACHDYQAQDANVLIALHTRRGLPTIKAFRARYPQRAIIAVATGTDLYKDLPNGDTDALEGMRLADAIVTYQDHSAADVPAEFAAKVRTIWKSIELPITENLPEPPATPKTFTILAHLRETKDPFLTVRALQHLDAALPIEARHFGTPLEAGLEAEALGWMRRENRYHWSTPIPREEVAAAIRSSHATINTGKTEGGSNAVCESIVLGTPVLATETPANIGFLGRDYGGYFPVSDARALAQLIERCCQPDATFLHMLASQLEPRADLFRPATESAGWKILLDELRHH